MSSVGDLIFIYFILSFGADFFNFEAIVKFINSLRLKSLTLVVITSYPLLPLPVDSSGDHTCSRKYYCSQHLTVGDRGARRMYE